jgi:MFS family permease
MSDVKGYRRALSFGFPFKTFTRDIWLLCLCNGIGAFGEGLYFWTFPLYIKSLNADYVQLGLVFSMLYFVGALAPIPGGFLADRFDRKKIMLLAWTPWAFAPLIYSFAENWVQLIPGAVCWGVSTIGVPAFTAYIITSTGDKTKLASVLSFVWATYSFSYIFAPAVGAYLATIMGMQWVLRISTVFSVISTSVFFFVHSQHPLKNATEKHQPSSPPQKNTLWRKLLLWTAFYTAMSFFMSVGRTYVPTFLNEEIKLNEFLVGLFGSVNFAGMAIMGIAMGHLADRWKKSGTIGLCLVFYIFSVIPLMLVRETASLMVIAFLLGSSAVTGSLVSSFIGTIAPENKRGSWTSIPLTMGLLAAFVAPYLSGYLYTASPYYTFIVSISAVPFLALFALTKLKD